MDLLVGELNVENYKKLGFRDLEQLYTQRVVPYLNKNLEAACTLLESNLDEKDLSGRHQLASSLAKQFLVVYNIHAAKEISLFNALRGRKTDKIRTEIPKLIESHKQMSYLLEQINKISDQCNSSETCSAQQKLGYAHINNLYQDVSRLSFLEEEYLFPRIPILNE